MKLNIFLGPFGDKATWSCIFPVLGKWAFLLYLKCYLYLSFQFPASTSIFMNAVVVSLSTGFLLCKGMAVLSDTKHQAMPYSAKTFLESLPQMSYIWVFQKTFYRIVWCSDSWEAPSLYARKKAIWWRDDGMIKKYRIERNFKTLKRQWILEYRIIFTLNPLNDIGVWMQIFIMTAMVNHGLS